MLLAKENHEMKNRTKQAGKEEVDHLRELCDIAYKGGAEDTVVISTDDIIIDPRVRLKCMIAPCYNSGTCRNCPPYGYSIEDTRSMVAQYEKAIFFRVAAPESYLSAPGMASFVETSVFDDKGAGIIVGACYLICYQIVAPIEKRARQLKYEPFGFAGADCKEVLCFFYTGCRAIKDKKYCRHPDLSKPAMEGSGMNVFAMAANAGWDIYPIGSTCQPGDAARGSILGLVLIC